MTKKDRKGGASIAQRALQGLSDRRNAVGVWIRKGGGHQPAEGPCCLENVEGCYWRKKSRNSSARALGEASPPRLGGKEKASSTKKGGAIPILEGRETGGGKLYILPGDELKSNRASWIGFELLS